MRDARIELLAFLAFSLFEFKRPSAMLSSAGKEGARRERGKGRAGVREGGGREGEVTASPVLRLRNGKLGMGDSPGGGGLRLQHGLRNWV